MSNEELGLERFNCFVTHTPFNVSVMKPFMPFNSQRRGQNFNAKQAWRGAIQGIKALNRMKGTLGTKLRPDLIMITGHEKGHMQVRNLDSGQVQRSATHYNNVKVNNIVVTNSYIYTTTEKDILKGKRGDDCDVYVWDLNSMKIFERLDAHEERVTCVAVCEVDEHIAVTGSMDRMIIVWDIRLKVKVTAKLIGHNMMVAKVLIIGRNVYSGSSDSTVRVWDVDGTAVATFEGHSGPVSLMEWSVSPMDKRSADVPAVLLTGCGGGAIKEWVVQPNGNLKLRWTVKPHNGQITDLVDDGPLVMSAGTDGVLNFYNRNTQNSVRVARPETASVRCLEIDFARKYLLIGTDTGHVVLWDYSLIFAGSQKEDDVRSLISLAPHSSAITAILLERDVKGKWERVITASLDNTLFALDFMVERDSSSFPTTARHVVQLPVTGSVVTGLDSRAIVWDLYKQCRKDKPKDVLHGHTAALTSIQYSVEVERLLTSSEDGTVRAWDVSHFSEAEMKHEELLETGEILQVGFPVKVMSNPCGEQVVVAGAKGTRAGVVAIIDFAGGGRPTVTFNIPFVPVKAVFPLPGQILLQHRSGEVVHYSVDGSVLRTTSRETHEGGQEPTTYPHFLWNVDTNWDPHHVIVLVADNRTLRCIDLTGDHVMWTANATAAITHVCQLRQAQMECVYSTDKGETVIVDKKGTVIFEILHDGSTTNVADSTSAIPKRRRSLADLLTGRLSTGIEVPLLVTALTVNMEARYVVMGYADGVVQLWDSSTRRVVRRFHATSAPTSIHVFPSQGRMMTFMADSVRIDTLYSRTDQRKASTSE